jgi:hypothetical protein
MLQYNSLMFRLAAQFPPHTSPNLHLQSRHPKQRRRRTLREPELQFLHASPDSCLDQRHPARRVRPRLLRVWGHLLSVRSAIPKLRR